MGRDELWEQVFASIRKSGSHVHFHIEVPISNGLLVSRDATISINELDTAKFPFYRWMLDKMVDAIDDQVHARV